MINERLQRAIELHRQGQLAQARRICEEILGIQPDHFDVLNLLGVISAQTRNYKRAIDLIDQAIAIFPHHVDCYFNRGLAQKALGRWDAAVASFEQAIALKPEYAEAWFSRGNSLNELKRLEPAVASYEKAIALKPEYLEAWFNRGIALLQLRDWHAAIENFDQAIVLKPEYAEAWSNRGIALHELKQWKAAVESYDQAIALKPDYAEACSNRGNALVELKEWAAAFACYDQAIALKPGYVEAWYNRGNALEELKEWKAAVGSYDKAIALNPDYAEAWSKRGNALLELKEPGAALTSFERAIALKPDFAEAWSNKGNALSDINKWDEALASYERAIALKPDFAEAWFNRGNVLKELSNPESAAASFARAFLLNPDGDYLLGAYLYLAMMICDWTSFDELSSRMASKIVNHDKVAVPVQVLSLTGSPKMQQQVAVTYMQQNHPLRLRQQDLVKPQKHDKIRVGYYSADFHNHASMYWVAEMFEKHDRSKFELIAFSFGPDLHEDAMRKRVVPAFDRFLDVRTSSDEEVALLSRELEIDIAVDLKGFTRYSRTDIFAFRAAPIQVNYMGYPGTMGTGYMDYIIADHTLIPEEQQQFYSEKIAYLPDSYQANDSKRKIADRVFTRQELGLPATGFVFCCFNNNYKITPDIFDCWMRILDRVEGSVLWLFENNPQAAINLQSEALRRGVDVERLIFARRMALPEHLARHRVADLFLDTLPCNAHTTASDALWAGLPVLTRIGETFAGRVAASLLNAIRLPELITSSMDEYEALAIELATNPGKLAQIKHKLDKNRLATPLFDSDQFTRNIEAAYRDMYERYHLDLPPDHLFVKHYGPLKQK